ncbi:MAG TPA: hypothetical protein VN887_18845 [Candidatus Angelobacter sp.]|nr:hypothetical protein [Candidatus Angelobacter sp.]
MQRASILPEGLRYLQPFRKKFASRSPEKLNEDTGLAILLPLLGNRIEAHSAAEAEKLLREDLAALQEWLSALEQENDCLHFAIGFLMVSPSGLVKWIQEESKRIAEPPLYVEMDLPTDAKLRKDSLISWKGLLIALDVVSEKAAATLAEVEAQGDGRVEISVSSVRFGEVVGTKFVRTGESWRGPFKEVRYVLTVPGGRVCASASALGKNLDEAKWDESKLEARFHTLRVVSKRPQHD